MRCFFAGMTMTSTIVLLLALCGGYGCPDLTMPPCRRFGTMACSLDIMCVEKLFCVTGTSGALSICRRPFNAENPAGSRVRQQCSSAANSQQPTRMRSGGYVSGVQSQSGV